MLSHQNQCEIEIKLITQDQKGITKLPAIFSEYFNKHRHGNPRSPRLLQFQTHTVGANQRLLRKFTSLR